MAKIKTATIKERNVFFNILAAGKRDQSVAIHTGHRFERAAREFEAEGLVRISDTGPREGEVLQIIRTF